MQAIETKKYLTHKAVMSMLATAVASAEGMAQPQCIVIVDSSGEELGKIRMTGAKFLSLRSALAKALTAASTGKPSDKVRQDIRHDMGLATDGAVTALKGGLPIIVDGDVVGGIGVGSGTGDEDIAVAKAALAEIGAVTEF